jgi:hypothetical protein
VRAFLLAIVFSPLVVLVGYVLHGVWIAHPQYGPPAALILGTWLLAAVLVLVLPDHDTRVDV